MSALDAMAAVPQWVNWQLVQKPGGKKPDKVPVSPVTRRAVDPHDPSQWMDYAEACRAAQAAGFGVGFVFTERDPFFFLDIDGCLGMDGRWEPHALDLVARFPGAACEVSVSGQGLHVFGSYHGVAPDHGTVAVVGGKKVELYSKGRFAALGTGAQGDAGTDCTTQFHTLCAQYFPPSAAQTGSTAWTSEPQPGSGIADDTELIRRALAASTARAAFGGGVTFKDLWEGNEAALAQAYPDPERTYDASRADSALAAHLTFWSGGNCDQVWRLMWQSGLRRPKWDDRHEYVQRTIIGAVSTANSFYTGSSTTSERPDPEDLDADDPIEPTVDFPFVPPDVMKEMWKDHIYVRSVDRILAPDGDLLDQSRFKHMFSRRVYPMDWQNGKPTIDAWKAYMHGHVWDFLRATDLCFLPGDETRLIPEGERIFANTWRDPKPVRRVGDASPFTDHLHRLLPKDRDYEILLAYMAACVQHQGTKFTWCPMIQGVQGNGKSTLPKILEHAIGKRYVHVMQGNSLVAQFNGWLASNVLVIVEDIHIGSSNDSSMEIIKPMITAERLQIERKGIDQTTEDICVNFILTTNHQDAIPLDPNERRFAVFFCAQQSKEDLDAQGMTDPYFLRLYAWLQQEHGYEITADFLWSYDIPDELNPAVFCKTAPETSSHTAAVEASRSPAAQFLYEAIEAEDVGFRGGWVSTIRAQDLLKLQRYGLSPRRLAGVLRSLGYVKAAQAPRPVASEGGRPTLYVRRGHLALKNTGPAEMLALYEKAQGYASSAQVEAALRQA